MADQQIDKLYIDIEVKNTGITTLQTATNNLQKIINNVNTKGIDISVTKNTLDTITNLGNLYRQLNNVQRVLSRPLVLDVQTKTSSKNNRNINKSLQNSVSQYGSITDAIKDIKGNKSTLDSDDIKRLEKINASISQNQKILSQFGLSETSGYVAKQLKSILDEQNNIIGQTAKFYSDKNNSFLTLSVDNYGNITKSLEVYKNLGLQLEDTYIKTKNLNDGITKNNYILEDNNNKWLKNQTQIKQTQDGLQKTTTTFNQAGQAISNVTQLTDKFGNVTTITSGKIDNARNVFSKFGNGLMSTVSKITVFGFGISQVSSLFQNFVNESNQYIENLNLFRVTFGELADEAERFVNTYSNALGLDPSQVMRNMGFFNQIVTGFGVSAEEGYKMSKLLTQLSYDLSSFVNIDIDEAILKFQSGIAGELEPLRRVGYALDEVTLQQVAYNHGIEKSIRNMSQSEKAYLRLWAMYEQSKNVMGDLAATITSPANALRILDQQFTLLKRSIGNAIVPIVTELIPIIQGATKALTEFFNLLAESLGYEVEGARENAYADYMDEITQSAQDAENAINGTLLSFDKFSVLGAEDNADDTFTLPIPEYDALATLANSISDTSESFKNTYEIFANLLMNEDRTGFSDALQAILDLINAIWEAVSGLWKAIAPDLIKSLTAVINAIASVLVDIVGMLDRMGILIPVISGMLMITFLQKIIKSVTSLASGMSILQKNTQGAYLTFGNFVRLLTMGMSVFFTIDTILSQLDPTMRRTASAILLVASALAAVVALVIAFRVANSWGTALPIIIGSVAAGIAAFKGLLSSYNIGNFATGGFTPETTGSLFMAGENGRPELMGTVRGKNAVANVNSIEDAMEQASYRGMVMAINQTNQSNNIGNQDIILQIDGKELARANVKNTANALSRNYRVELNPR